MSKNKSAPFVVIVGRMSGQGRTKKETQMETDRQPALPAYSNRCSRNATPCHPCSCRCPCRRKPLFFSCFALFSHPSLLGMTHHPCLLPSASPSFALMAFRSNVVPMALLVLAIIKLMLSRCYYTMCLPLNSLCRFRHSVS